VNPQVGSPWDLGVRHIFFKLIIVVKGSSMCLRLRMSSLEPKKLLVLNINGVLCYFPPLSVLQRNAKMFGKNVNKTKMETFFSEAFQKFHIGIWFCMKLENALEVFPMLMLEFFSKLVCFHLGMGIVLQNVFMKFHPGPIIT